MTDADQVYMSALQHTSQHNLPTV